jgi:hypothetical protein
MRALLDKTAGHRDVIIPTGIMAALVLPGIIMSAAGADPGAGAGLIIMPLLFWAPWAIGYLMGRRKRRIPLRDAVLEVHERAGQMKASAGRIESMVSSLTAAPEPAKEAVAGLRLVKPSLL